MDGQKIKSDIINKFSIFLESLPVNIRDSVLLTGGSAAFLYGSDRPFSNDIDVMVPEKFIPKIEKIFNVKFSLHKNKPVFHSLKCAIEINGIPYDVIAESVIEPPGSEKKCCFYLTNEIIDKKENFSFKNKTISCIPKELLVVIKLLAGRGEELNKYDLYDVDRILEKNNNFDYQFFKTLITKFCKPLSSIIPILMKNAKSLKGSNIIALTDALL